MGPYERMMRHAAMQRANRGMGRLGDGSAPMAPVGGPGSSSGLPPVPGMWLPAGIPANAGGSIVQGDGFVYTYNIIFAASLAAAANSTVTLQFDQVTVFKWVRTTCYANIADASQLDSTRVLPCVTLKITDAGSGMAFMNSPVPMFDVAGHGDLPYVLPTPQFVLANAVLQFTALNITAGTTYTNLMLQLHGYKLYNYQQQNSAQ
jgi:hypothetical protein